LFHSSPAEGLEGSYRFVLSGAEHVTVRAAISDVIPIPEIANMELSGQFLPGQQIIINNNSTCSTWMDVEELIRSQDVDVFMKDGLPAHEQFLEFLAEAKAIQPHLGNY
jgi:hypothetical protein